MTATTRVRRAAGATAIVAAVLATTAGAILPQTYAQLLAVDVPGMAAGAVSSRVTDGSGLVIQDLSTLAGKEPTFDVADSDSFAWTVLAVCASSDTIETSHDVELAVIPTADVDPAMSARIARHGYTDLLDCSDVH